jgi:hypothetical protein
MPIYVDRYSSLNLFYSMNLVLFTDDIKRLTCFPKPQLLKMI